MAKRKYTSKASYISRFVAWIIRTTERKCVYVSGPMTGLPKLNRPTFTRVACRLRDQGYTVINPADFPDGVWKTCLIRDLILLLFFCNKVAFLPKWKKSKGATLEIHVAKALNYRIKPYKYWLTRNK